MGGRDRRGHLLGSLRSLLPVRRRSHGPPQPTTPSGARLEAKLVGVGTKVPWDPVLRTPRTGGGGRHRDDPYRGTTGRQTSGAGWGSDDSRGKGRRDRNVHTGGISVKEHRSPLSTHRTRTVGWFRSESRSSVLAPEEGRQRRPTGPPYTTTDRPSPLSLRKIPRRELPSRLVTPSVVPTSGLGPPPTSTCGDPSDPLPDSEVSGPLVPSLPRPRPHRRPR